MKKTDDRVLRVALMPRVSTEEQVLRGYSLDAQEEALIEYANNNNMKIVGIYRDEGHSARKPVLKRPVMLQLLEDVKAGKIDRILFVKLDRWFRNVSEYHTIQTILDQHNVTWQAILEDYNTTTADGRLKVNIMLSVAENEADRTSERIKFVFDSKRAKKEVFFQLPFGYKTEIIDGVRRAVKDPETEHIVEEFLQRALATNIAQAGQEMNQKYNLEFGYRFWWGLTRRDFYFGEYRGIEGFSPAYITKEEAMALRNTQTSYRKAQKDRIYLFSGLLICPTCGRRLKAKCGGTSKKYPNMEYFYYRCARSNVGNCDFTPVSERNIEKYLLENVRSEMEKYIASTEAEQNIAKNTKQKKSDVEKLQEKLRRTNVAFFAGNMTDEEYAAQTKEIKDQIAKAQIEEVKAQKPVDTEAIKALLSTDFEAIYQTLAREEQRILWRTIIDQIVPVGHETIKIKFKS